MFQIFRCCKLESHLISRHYGSQRKNRTHYEVLQIPETSSQKEIREAFIKLSKEMHPDIKGKESHAEFVKINDAYKILSKENLRRGYDMNLKNGYSSKASSSYSYPPYSVYRSKRPYGGFEYYGRSSQFSNSGNWEEYSTTQQGTYYYGSKRVKRAQTFWIVFMCLTFATISSIFQIIAINKRMLKNRESIMRKNMQYTNELNQPRDNASMKTIEERIQDFVSEREMNRLEKNETENPDFTIK